MATLRPKFDPFSKQEIDLLHERSLDLLWDPGIRFPHQAPLDILAQHGATVDRSSQVARIPPELVHRSLETCPRAIRLAACDPAHDLVLDGTATHFSLGIQPAEFCITENGQLRPSTFADLAQALQLANALQETEILTLCATASDIPLITRALRGLALAWTITGKHLRIVADDPDQVPFLLELAEIVTHGEAVTPRGAVFSAVKRPDKPLQHDPAQVRACLALAAYGVPILVAPRLVAGATAPGTPAGAALVANVAVLSAIVLYQCVNPGVGVIYGAIPPLIQASSGTARYSPQGELAMLMGASLARRYGLPVSLEGLSTAAQHLGPQSGWESLNRATVSTLFGGDELASMGRLDHGRILSLEKLVSDAELVRQLQRLDRGMEYGEHTLLAEVIARVGPEGHYLGQRETRDLMRSEIYIPKIQDSRSQAAWLSSGLDEHSRFRPLVREVLSTYPPRPIPAGLADEVDRLLARAANELGAEGQRE